MKKTLLTLMLFVGIAGVAKADWTLVTGVYGTNTLVGDESGNTASAASVTGAAYDAATGKITLGTGTTATVDIPDTAETVNSNRQVVYMTLTGLQVLGTDQKLVSYKLNGYGLSYTVNTSAGLDNASVSLYIGGSVNSEANKTFTVTGLDLSGDSVTLALGYIRQTASGNNSTALFAMSSNDLTSVKVSDLQSFLLTKEVSSVQFGTTQIVKESTTTGLSDAVVANVTIDEFRIYASTDNNATVTASELSNLMQAKSVPEPATATLSLLALAGLAARRRRK